MLHTALATAAFVLSHVVGTSDGVEPAPADAPPSLPPFSFSLGGATVRSTALPATWAVSSATFAEPNNRTRTDITLTAPGGMQVQVEQTEFAEFPGATEWLLRFRNDGAARSAQLCNVSALDTTLLPSVLGHNATVHRFEGSHASATDYRPIIYSVPSLRPPPAPTPSPPSPSGGHPVHGPGGNFTMQKNQRLWCHHDCGKGIAHPTFPSPTAQSCQVACAGNAACVGCTWVVGSKECFMLARLDSTDAETGCESSHHSS
jgi:hypothetical protein